MSIIGIIMDQMARLTQSRGGRLLLRVFFYGATVLVALPATFCHVMTHVPPQAINAAPSDFEEIAIDNIGLRLRGWLAREAPPSTRPAVLVIHGFGDNLESYVEVGRAFRRRGHAVLLIDLRGHGGSAGRGTTLGDHESGDVRAALARLRREGLAVHGVVLVGYSLGATSALLAAVGQDDVRAVIVESPFDSLRETVAHHGTLLYHIPRWVPLAPIAIAFAETYKGFEADRVDTVAAARRLRAPLFALAGAADPRMPEVVVRRIYDAHPGPKAIWIVPGADHMGAQLHVDYERRVMAFLDEHGL